MGAARLVFVAMRHCRPSPLNFPPTYAVCTWSVDSAVFELELGNALALRRRDKAAARLARAASLGESGEAAADAAAVLGVETLSFSGSAPDPESRELEPHGGRSVYCVDWSPDGRVLASGDEGGGVVIWSSE